MRAKFIKFLKFVFITSLSFGAGYVGMRLMGQDWQQWYAALAKPEFAPPNVVFGYVWSTLYFMIAIAAFLVWMKSSNLSLLAVRGLARVRHKQVKIALFLFVVQLALNAVWPWFFFGQRDLFAALVVIVLMLFAIIVNTILFYRVSHMAGYLFLPYVAWVGFAAYLNYTILILN